MTNIELAHFMCQVMHTLACMVAYYISGKRDKVKKCEDAYEESLHLLETMMEETE